MSHDDHAVRAMSQMSIGSQKEDRNYCSIRDLNLRWH